MYFDKNTTLTGLRKFNCNGIILKIYKKNINVYNIIILKQYTTI